MSRLEKAMQKAAQLRQGTPAPPPAPHAVEPPAHDSRGILHDQQQRQQSTTPAISPSPYLVNLNTPFSAAAEEFRKIKSILLNRTKENGFLNTLMITSAIPGEGKTITSLNLAISLAEELDHTVLLVESDLRRPTIHRYLNLEDRPGFSECLLGEADLKDAIIPTGIGKLSIIRAGHSVPNPSELFSSQRTADLIFEMKSRYNDRYIIFDTPPLLPFTDARSLSKLVDAVIFVAMERHASRHDIQEAVELLSGCNTLGMVYNKSNEIRQNKRYSYYQRYTQEAQQQ